MAFKEGKRTRGKKQAANFKDKVCHGRCAWLLFHGWERVVAHEAPKRTNNYEQLEFLSM